MKHAEELYHIIMRHSKAVRETLGDAKFIYGEIYADMMFGALLSAVSDSNLRMRIANIAFEKYRSKAAMCVSLEREELAAEAMSTALENGIGEAVKIHLGVKPAETLITAFIEDLDA